MILQHASIPLYCDPGLRPGVAALAEWLRDHHYSAHAADCILGHVAASGCLASAAYLDREDEPEATEVFIAALPDVAGDSPAWDLPDAFLDVELLAAGRHPLPFGPEPLDVESGNPPLPALPDLRAPEDWPLPISGGSPEAGPGPFTPTAADWADYRNHFDAAEPLYGYE